MTADSKRQVRGEARALQKTHRHLALVQKRHILAVFMMKRRVPVRTELRMNRHGGKREGAGRPRSSKAMPHVARERFPPKTPLHVTLRMARHVWNLRSQRGFGCVEHALAHEAARGQLRIVHFSVQGNHIHLIVEADDTSLLSRRMQGFGIRLARALNVMMKRRGKVIAERYHVREISGPRQMHRALRYVLLNHAHHGLSGSGVAVDRYSSAPSFPNVAYAQTHVRLRKRARLGASEVEAPIPVTARATYWVLAAGWRKIGTISLTN
ncbi:hypothetical protein BH09MYX1_BH09MYX1_30210 [soil metagenome]